MPNDKRLTTNDFFLTDKKAEDDENDANPLAERQMFAEEKEHPKGGKRRTDIIECVRLCNPYFAEREAEKDKRYHAGEDRQIGDAAERNH